MKHAVRITAFALTAIVAAASCIAVAAQQKRAAVEETVYVAAYSSIFHGDREREFDLAVTLSVRNTDMRKPITVYRVDYHDGAGKPVHTYLNGDRVVNPLAAAQFVVKESDERGGSGACFIVKWRGATGVSRPLVESVMIGTGGQQGVSFTSRGVTIPR
jgi:hypothetical protein